jgi:proteasome accessory factor C
VPERRRAAPKTSERLGQMLVVVPYLVQHPGSKLPEVADLFGLDPAHLRGDLDLLFMSGLPPYGPGDLIDVDVDEDDRISIKMAEHFARPLRLTRSEARALYIRGTELVATPGMPEAPALAGALDRLRDSLGADALADTHTRIETAVSGARVPEHLDLLRTAAGRHERLEIEYFAASTGEWSHRRVDPEAIFSSLGNWYVAAWDADANAERLFRADRIRRADPTGERFKPRGLEGAGRPLYTSGQEDVPVRLRLQPAARWIAEYYATVDPVEHDDGSLEVTLPARQLGWVARLLLRVEPDVAIVTPLELVDAVRELARQTLLRYHPATS